MSVCLLACTQVGDGDCGDTLVAGANALLTALDESRLDLNNPSRTIAQVAAVLRRVMGGTSGALYDVALTAASVAIGHRTGGSNGSSSSSSSSSSKHGASRRNGSGSSSSGAGLQAWVEGFVAGVEAIEKYGGVGSGSRTMVDALLPAATALQQALAEGKEGFRV